MSEEIVQYSPQWAPHVQGEYTRRQLNDDGSFEPQKVRMQCAKCGDAWQTTCTSGMVRDHIHTFANLHLHADPFGRRRDG